MSDILFVCTGNTCRSPMAEALAKAHMPDHMTISSCGLSVSYGQGANVKSIIAMDMEGLDIRSHRARQFQTQMVNKDTVILGMTHGHKDYLLAYYPALKGQVYTLLEYAQMKGEVSDPYGADQDTYNDCAKLLKKAIMKISDKY